MFLDFSQMIMPSYLLINFVLVRGALLNIFSALDDDSAFCPSSSQRSDSEMSSSVDSVRALLILLEHMVLHSLDNAFSH